ncbi:hypothetical protein PHABIO_39 [Pseudomonas phage Phabio]|uniref:Divergent DnaB-like ATPase domain-containing protein n=1 Tax=Pseudomonas phage Phabio TaxID=2006668 RepID=A0A1Y0STM7_9CAUD|nr:hypothetical protein MZD05_gp039 [Pseudomonas phage Phabio]ARV76670.1 hypothetical protein PHABIO_39 [Pseudomonas phage Phabio]
MISKGKRKYLLELYPFSFWVFDWIGLAKEIRETPPNWTSVKAFMPEHDPSRIMVGTCDGIYPVRDKDHWNKAEKNLTGESHAWKSDHIPTVQEQTFVKEIATKGYYDGVKRLDSECDVEVFFGIDTLGPNAKTITISRSTISGIDKGQPKFESVDLIEVPNDFKEAREKTL